MSKTRQHPFTTTLFIGFSLGCLAFSNLGFNTLPVTHPNAMEAQGTSTSVYIDPEFGFSARVPDGWKSEGGHLVDLYTYIYEARFTAPTSSYRAIVVDVQPVSTAIPLVNWVISTVDTNGYKYEELEDSGAVNMVSMDGEPAVQVHFPSGYVLSTYVKSPNGFGYLISLQQIGDNPSLLGNAPEPASFQQDDQAIYKAFIDAFRLGELTPRLEALKKTSVEPLENAIANTFRFPLDSDSLSFIYAVHPLWWDGDSPCYQTAYKNLYHAGEDWANTPGTEVKAVANGVVAIYQPGYNTYPGRVVVIEHELPDRNIVYSMYGHLDEVYVYQDQNVYKGKTIGTILYWPGDPDNSHVHWEMRYFPDGSNLCPYRKSGYYGPGYTYPDHPDSYGYTNPSNFVNSHNGITGCPYIYGEVRLYDLNNCGGNFTPANRPGLWDLTDSFNDLAESIIVPNGWSARLYKQDNELISSACFTTTDKDLGDDKFDDGTTVANETTWMRVFGNSSCYGLPKAPSLTSPGNGQVFVEGDSIPFSWSATGSEYYGEIWGGPDGKLTFGWQTETSWSMGSLPAGYKYYWHVKARNASGTSGWSSTRTFLVRPRRPAKLSATTPACYIVDLSWIDRSDYEDGFKIYRDGFNVGSVGSNVTSYRDSGLSVDTSYTYTARAYRGSILSFSSSPVNVTTLDCDPLPQVSVSASPDPIALSGGKTKQVIYTFTEEAGGSGRITSRTQRFFTKSGDPLSVSSDPLIINITLLPNGSVNWTDKVFLPVDVVNNAYARGVSTIVLIAVYEGEATSGFPFTAESLLTINLPPPPLTSIGFLSEGAYDGSVLEVGELKEEGGSVEAVGTTFRLGDASADRQYRAILSFFTASLPDKAVISSVVLKIKKQGLVGTNPFTILNSLILDIRKPAFGSKSLETSDFQTPASLEGVGTFGSVPTAGWYTASLAETSYPFINLTGTTQFRLLFQLDDNDDGENDYMKFYSGDAQEADRPLLNIKYYLP